MNAVVRQSSSRFSGTSRRLENYLPESLDLTIQLRVLKSSPYHNVGRPATAAHAPHPYRESFASAGQHPCPAMNFGKL